MPAVTGQGGCSVQAAAGLAPTLQSFPTLARCWCARRRALHPHLCSMHAAAQRGPGSACCCCCQRAAAAGVHQAALCGQVAATGPHDGPKGTTALLAARRQAAAAAAAAEQRCCLLRVAAAVDRVAVAACMREAHHTPQASFISASALLRTGVQHHRQKTTALEHICCQPTHSKG